MGPSLPPLRAWRPTRCQAYSSLIEWSRDVHSLLCSIALGDEVRRLSLVDAIYERLISIHMWHAPSQGRMLRRRQPFWWTPACVTACIARNGAWRDHRRSQSSDDHVRFSAARMAFHRVVRSAQRTYWMDWQEHVSTHVRLLPQCVALFRARTVMCRLRSGGLLLLVARSQLGSSLHIGATISPQMVLPKMDPTTRISCTSLAGASPIFPPLAGLQASLMLCSPALSFVGHFLIASIRQLDLLDCLTLCFKVNFSWWQEAILNFYNLVFSWSAVPSLWKRSVIVSVFKREDPPLATNYRPISRVMNPAVGPGGALMLWWVHLSLSSLYVPLLTPSLPSSTFRWLSTRHGWKARWFVCLMPVSRAACGDSRPTFFQELNPKSVLAPLSPPLGATLVSLRRGFCHPFCSTFS